MIKGRINPHPDPLARIVPSAQTTAKQMGRITRTTHKRDSTNALQFTRRHQIHYCTYYIGNNITLFDYYFCRHRCSVPNFRCSCANTTTACTGRTCTSWVRPSPRYRYSLCCPYCSRPSCTTLWAWTQSSHTSSWLPCS